MIGWRLKRNRSDWDGNYRSKLPKRKNENSTKCTDRHSRSIYQLGKRNRRTNRQSRQSISQMGENKPRTNRNCDNRKNHNCIRNTGCDRKNKSEKEPTCNSSKDSAIGRHENTKDQEKPEYSGEIHGGRRGSGSILPDANLWPKKPSSAASIRPFNTIRL